MRVEWKATARNDLAEAVAWIARENPRAAIRVYAEVMRQVERLGRHPQSGRPGRIKDTRELVINRTPYIVPYQVGQSAVVVLRVLHGARRWPDAPE
ncbi:MAG TPA: type II toxin-antitoxin system RelE/ParE family toxin [Gammaproteobacteria bacterium]|nr:type II toxin-antitoxin system RelE/ParE family toxin [Gammaproteobacteria bacterium]